MAKNPFYMIRVKLLGKSILYKVSYCLYPKADFYMLYSVDTGEVKYYQDESLSRLLGEASVLSTAVFPECFFKKNPSARFALAKLRLALSKGLSLDEIIHIS